MSNQSSIEWTETTWNPLVGCTRVSAGCEHCYAETMAKRLGAMAQADIDAGRNPGKKRHYLNVLDKNGRWNGTVNLVEEALAEPLHWKKPRRVFVNSMSDLFHKDVPFEFIDKVFAVMALCPQHTFQCLSKRPERMAEYMGTLDAAGSREDIADHLGFSAPTMEFRTQDGPLDMTAGEVLREQMSWPLPNVWLGTSVEDQKTADERIPHLLRCPAAVRWLSMEPLLGPVILKDQWLIDPRECTCYEPEYGHQIGCMFHGNPEAARGPWPGLDWIVVGGESGAGAKPMHPDWPRKLRDQCVAAGVPYFFKQWGAWAPDCLCDKPNACRSIKRPSPGPVGCMFRCGKKEAGRTLDGRTWDEYPTINSQLSTQPA